MNYSTAVLVINDNARAVVGIYDPDQENKRTTYKTFDQSLKVGDLAVVESGTRHGVTTVKIVEVDVDVNFDSEKVINWIVCKIDFEQHQQTLKNERQAIDTIKSAETRRRRDELRESLLKDQEKTVMALPIAGDPAVAVSGGDNGS